MMDDNQCDIRSFVVFGKGDLSISPTGVDDLVIIDSGRERCVDGLKTEVQLEYAPEPGTPGSRFASRLTRVLVGRDDDILICYDLTMNAPGDWLSKLRNAGFAISTQPYYGTGRQLAICTGKGQYLAGIDWLEDVMLIDSEFLAACPNGCANFEHKIKTSGIVDIYELAIGKPKELWDLLGGTGLFAFIGGDEGDFFVVRLKGMDGARIVDALADVSRELGFSLYDAGTVSGWDARDLLLTTDLVKNTEWYAVPKHWRRIV